MNKCLILNATKNLYFFSNLCVSCHQTMISSLIASQTYSTLTPKFFVGSARFVEGKWFLF